MDRTSQRGQILAELLLVLSLIISFYYVAQSMQDRWKKDVSKHRFTQKGEPR